MRTPKKKRLKTTSRYIYETLFMEGRDSDIIVSALNRDWKLHKLYLCQSPYFSSMFNGNWRESNMDHIDITIVDPNISLDSMNVTLGSLYQDEISVEPAEVIPILATASLFQMDGLADQCANIMEETVNIETVTKYYETGVFYGSSRIQDACITWLKVNLLSHLPEHPAKLRQVPVDLMQRLVNHSGLFVMQTEFSVYVLLRLWIYLIFHPNWDGSPQDAVMSSHKFFQERVKRDKHYFLETEVNSHLDGGSQILVELFKGDFIVHASAFNDLDSLEDIVSSLGSESKLGDGGAKVVSGFLVFLLHQHNPTSKSCNISLNFLELLISFFKRLTGLSEFVIGLIITDLKVLDFLSQVTDVTICLVSSSSCLSCGFLKATDGGIQAFGLGLQ